jgi:hypothetical protein
LNDQPQNHSSRATGGPRATSHLHHDRFSDESEPVNEEFVLTRVCRSR